MGLTRPRDLAIAALVGGVAGWLLVRSIEAAAGQPPQLPWVGPLVLWFVAALVAGLAWTTWRRIQVRRERIEPERAVTFLAFGKASGIGGAAIAGGYLVFALLAIGHLDAEGPQQRLVRGLVAAVAGVAIGAAGLWLERACRVPDPPEGEDEAAREA
ncbi:hypothetical protein CGZ94_05465 [Enemella evansiae]|uniref:DUF3180 domain-containing protein n=2 Tax=Enemella evansiae TaxID=2016499 RepID=A0A255GP31_9ACTN|nr:hypothetical protein CGZ94_05465 [Enemella evansiae]